MASMAFAETETKVTKNPFALRWPQREGFLAEKRHVQQHRRHNTGELPNAHDHPGIEHCREECCQKRHCGVHDGIGHAKPPQLSVGIHHDGRHCQCAEVIQSLFLPFRENYSHCNPPARGELGPLHVVLLVDKEELLVWWHMETKTSLTENKHPGRRTRSSLNIDATAPRQTLLDQTEEFPPLLGHCGGRRTTFWRKFFVHVGAGRAKLPQVVEETELLLMSAVADHLLSVSAWTLAIGRLRKVMASREPKLRLFFVG